MVQPTRQPLSGACLWPNGSPVGEAVAVEALSLHTLGAGLAVSGALLVLLLLTDWVGFPDSSVGKESTCNIGDPGSISGPGRSAGEGTGYPFQYSGLENSVDFTVHGVAKSWTPLTDFHFSLSRIG